MTDPLDQILGAGGDRALADALIEDADRKVRSAFLMRRAAEVLRATGESSSRPEPSKPERAWRVLKKTDHLRVLVPNDSRVAIVQAADEDKPPTLRDLWRVEVLYQAQRPVARGELSPHAGGSIAWRVQSLEHRDWPEFGQHLVSSVRLWLLTQCRHLTTARRRVAIALVEQGYARTQERAEAALITCAIPPEIETYEDLLAAWQRVMRVCVDT